MFRNYNDENNFGGGGYINRGIDMSDESSSSANSSTTININRSKYDQQTLYHEMMYKKPQTTSCKLLKKISKITVKVVSMKPSTYFLNEEQSFAYIRSMTSSYSYSKAYKQQDTK
jgi:hypothetical protein